MSLTDDIRHVLAAWTPPDAEQQALRELFSSYATAHDEPGARACAPDHVTASALVISADHSAVALVLHPKFGRWLQTGGHCESADPSLAAAALREATEETGIAGLTIDPDPLLLSRHPVRCHEGGHHLDVQFVAVAPEGAEPQCSEESDDVRWFRVDHLPEPTDASVRSLVAAARSRLRGSPSPRPSGGSA
ncbi:NUDIX domain-containing protein [Aeromicrobium sp. 636]|uniref:NUDIX hydrolase n=1 Tax=Aeromicrobium senzhongii TaxID=2663859 RepID=A0A8I0EWE9_9ACTN|nr:NUDIX hydrolase [Aeromicrobium sp. 636]MBC9226442.1 NUDIX hydrolase [Aeromicrobium senzhongii]MCQ3998546.1 NUDIX domain-containing protein [Aeromicrobium sp. 636]